MGCDIHTTMQVRREGVWADAQPWVGSYGYLEPEGKEFLGDRNYALFGIIAGVRRDVPSPLAAYRGLPEGLSEQASEFHDGNHSATHFTLAEVLAYDWTQMLEREGVVDPSEWARWRDYGKPESWSGSVGGGNVTHHELEEFERAWVALRTARGYPETRNASAHLRPLSGQEHDDLDAFRALLKSRSPYTRVSWSEPYYDVAGEMFSHAVPRALRLGAPEDVRFIVSFDN